MKRKRETKAERKERAEFCAARRRETVKAELFRRRAKEGEFELTGEKKMDEMLYALLDAARAAAPIFGRLILRAGLALNEPRTLIQILLDAGLITEVDLDAYALVTKRGLDTMIAATYERPLEKSIRRQLAADPIKRVVAEIYRPDIIEKYGPSPEQIAEMLGEKGKAA